jgi:hypothetical protein
LGIRVVTFKLGGEANFARDILHFASDRYGSTETRNWTCMVTHVADPGAWVDLYDVSRHTFMEAGAADWPGSDAWSMSWDELTSTGWRHASVPRRRQLVTQLELNSFDAKVAQAAVEYDLVTFLNDSLVSWLANLHKMAEYPLYLLTHEVAHYASDWSGKSLVVDGVPPREDREVMKTLEAFVEHVGGWTELAKRYLV